MFDPYISKKRFSRLDTSLLGRWWWTVDRLCLGVLFVIIFIGIVLVFSASPPVAHRLKLPTFFFVYRHLLMLVPSLMVCFGFSLLSSYQIRWISLGLYIISCILLVAVLFMGSEIKGARRWISFLSVSFQPSELLKPSFAVLSAWILSYKIRLPSFPGMLLSFCALIGPLSLLLLQPDLGMSFITVCIWVSQIFIMGLSWRWISSLVALGGGGLFCSYWILPHVSKRVDQFLFPQNLDTKGELYQIEQSLSAFSNGGFWGRGPGEGIIKHSLPDAHADFIFSVAGEEFGFILCFLIAFLFFLFVARSFFRVMEQSSPFLMLSVTGLAVQFGLQGFVNMASSLHLIPTKGMTLPFISYGGSSSLALCIGIGILLSLTRLRRGFVESL